MPLCIRCRDFFPPDFMLSLQDGNEECVYCNKGVKHLQYTEKDGSVRNYTREECIRDYKILIGELKDTRDVKKILEKEKER